MPLQKVTDVKSFIVYVYLRTCFYHIEDFELESRHTTESTDHTALLGSDSNINYRSNQSTSTILVQHNSLGKDHPKRTCNDYIALHKPSNFATALESYSNLEKSFTYDYARTMECSEVSTNVEEMYLDPGHSKADICACFERKQFHIIKNEDVRCAAMLLQCLHHIYMVSVCMYVIVYEYTYVLRVLVLS